MLPKIPSCWLVFLLATLCATQSWADSITLKTGEQIVGTIKNETDSEVTIDVQISASITDERTIEKSDIASEQKEQPDDIAYKQLIQLQPNTQYSYSSDSYAQILRSLNQFETDYPNSAHLADVKQLAATFEDEKKRTDAGEYKYLGKWIPAAEAAARRIQIDAQPLYATMQQQATSGDFVGAMQTFANIEQNYKTTRVYPPAVALAREILASFVPELATRMQALKASEAQMRQTILATREPERSALVAQNKAEQDRAAAIVSNAIHAGVRWVPLIPDSEVSVSTLQRVATSEAQSLSGVPVDAMNQSIARVDAARTAIASKDYTAANVDLMQAVSLWGQNEAARYWLTQLKTDVVAAATPRPTPTPTPTPRPTPTPQMVNIITPPSPTPEAKPFYMTIPGALTIVLGVLVLAGIVAIAGKLKAKKDDEET